METILSILLNKREFKKFANRVFYNMQENTFYKIVIVKQYIIIFIVYAIYYIRDYIVEFKNIVRLNLSSYILSCTSPRVIF